MCQKRKIESLINNTHRNSRSQLIQRYTKLTDKLTNRELAVIGEPPMKRIDNEKRNAIRDTDFNRFIALLMRGHDA